MIDVATRTNALWQRYCLGVSVPAVGTSQPARMRCGKVRLRLFRCSSSKSQPARMRCGKETRFRVCCTGMGRNPRECAVAKTWGELSSQTWGRSQPARMRCGKDALILQNVFCVGRNPRECAVAKMRDGKPLPLRRGHNPRECAVAKSRHCCARTGNSESMNYVLLF